MPANYDLMTFSQKEKIIAICGMTSTTRAYHIMRLSEELNFRSRASVNRWASIYQEYKRREGKYPDDAVKWIVLRTYDPNYNTPQNGVATPPVAPLDPGTQNRYEKVVNLLAGHTNGIDELREILAGHTKILASVQRSARMQQEATEREDLELQVQVSIGEVGRVSDQVVELAKSIDLIDGKIDALTKRFGALVEHGTEMEVLKKAKLEAQQAEQELKDRTFVENFKDATPEPETVMCPQHGQSLRPDPPYHSPPSLSGSKPLKPRSP